MEIVSCYNVADATNYLLGEINVKELIGPMGVGAWTEHSRHHELCFWKHLTQHACDHEGYGSQQLPDRSRLE